MRPAHFRTVPRHPPWSSAAVDQQPSGPRDGLSPSLIEPGWVLSRRDVLAVGVASVALIVVSGWRFQIGWAWPPYATCLIGILLLCVVDARSWRLPRELVYATTLAAGALLVAASWRLHRFDDLRTALIAAAGVGAGFKVLTIVARRRGGVLGDGDVRFGAMCAGFAGWLDGRLVLVWLCAGFGCGAISGLIHRHRYDSTRSPFGPPLGLAFAFTTLWSSPLVHWLFTASNR